MANRTFLNFNIDNCTTNTKEYEIEEPRICNHCNNVGVQTFITGSITGRDFLDTKGIGLFACPLCGCTTIHFFEKELNKNLHEVLIPFDTIPAPKENLANISIDLQNEFPDFYNIYFQSEKAEEVNLDQIAGMGYRKSLEFLVTDYLLNYIVDESEKDWLKDPKTSLSSKISKIPRQRIQNLAKAISFLGNDETHYTRRHPEHDINSMKAFIRVLVSEIQNEIEYKKAEELLNKPS